MTIRTEAYMMQVPRSQRGGEVIEPMVSTQWFVRMEPLAKPALDAVRSGQIRIIPERFTKVYYNWLETSGLVYLTPAVVGPPHSRLVLQRM